MSSKSTIRDLVMAALMLGAALYAFTHPAQKHSPEEKINLSSFIPAGFKEWRSVTRDTSDYKDKWQSINELLVRSYYKKQGGLIRTEAVKVDFVLEYSSDLRRNFSFHFPEGCHRAGGDEVVFLEPLEIDLGNGNIIKAKCLYIKGLKGSLEGVDKIVVYWLTIDNKQYYRTFFIKLDQMLSGLLRQSKKGFLLRVDFYDLFEYSEEGIQKARETITDFIKDLYEVLGEKEREMLFGRRGLK